MNGFKSVTIFIILHIWSAFFKVTHSSISLSLLLLFSLWITLPQDLQQYVVKLYSNGLASKGTHQRAFAGGKKLHSLAKINHDILLSLALQSQTHAPVSTPPCRTLHIQISILYCVITLFASSRLSFCLGLSSLGLSPFSASIFLLYTVCSPTFKIIYQGPTEDTTLCWDTFKRTCPSVEVKMLKKNVKKGLQLFKQGTDS